MAVAATAAKANVTVNAVKQALRTAVPLPLPHRLHALEDLGVHHLMLTGSIPDCSEEGEGGTGDCVSAGKPDITLLLHVFLTSSNGDSTSGYGDGEGSSSGGDGGRAAGGHNKASGIGVSGSASSSSAAAATAATVIRGFLFAEAVSQDYRLGPSGHLVQPRAVMRWRYPLTLTDHYHSSGGGSSGGGGGIGGEVAVFAVDTEQLWAADRKAGPNGGGPDWLFEHPDVKLQQPVPFTATFNASRVSCFQVSISLTLASH